MIGTARQMIQRRASCLALAIVLAAACSSGPGNSGSPAGTPVPSSSAAATAAPPSASPPAPTPTTAATPKPTLTLPEPIDLLRTTATRIDARPNPDFIVLVGGYAFVSGVGNGIGRFDGTTGGFVDSFTIPGDSCEALDAGFGAAWTATCSGPGLARIDAVTGVVTTVELGGQIPDPEASIGVGEGGVWIIVGGGSPRTLLRVDPATMSVAAAYEIPGRPTAVRAGLGSVWVSDPTLDRIHRVDPDSGAIVATIAVGAQPQFIAVGEGALWTMDQVSGTVSRVDPATNRVVATIQLGEQVRGGDIAAGGGSIWLRGSRTLLFRIDPATNEIVERYNPSSGSGSVAADDQAVWITAHDVTAIWRLEYSGVVE